MSHRVIAGTARGRKLKMVPGRATRPIMDRVKEALFSILVHDVPGCRLLDLFAGTGAVGIEALSRGAAHVRFLDNDWAAIRTIKENLEHTGLSDRAEVLRTNSLDYLRRTQAPSFDIVYIAPPQYQGIWKTALVGLENNLIHLNPDAQVIVQLDPTENEPVQLERLELFDQRRYGNTTLLFFEFTSDDGED